jgi:dTDP-4-amino-4,6-dideoxygalactose transaminase
MGINKDTYARTSDRGAYRWLYDVESVGFKYHGNSIMAAIGLVQMRYLDRDTSYRRQVSEWYDAGLGESNRIGIIRTAPDCESSRHLYQIHLENRDEMMLALNGCGIYPGVHYRDNREYRMFRQERDTCPHATRMSQRIMSLPLHLRLTRKDVDAVVERIQAYAH